MKSLKLWILAIRPKTLAIAVAPVVVGVAIAGSDNLADHPLTAALILICALLIQIATNLYNDAADFERGADTPDRQGPPRVTAKGWLKATEVKRAAWSCFVLALLIGVQLANVGGWPIIVMGLASLGAGYAYTAGPRPIAYSPTGELFVFVFFGLIAVTGTDYLLSGAWHGEALYAGSALGLLAAAVLLVNNTRDLDTDRRANKLTLAHHLGRAGCRHLYSLMMLLPIALPLLPGLHAAWPVLLSLPLSLRLARRFRTAHEGSEFNSLLEQTARAMLIYSLLLALGVTLPDIN